MDQTNPSVTPVAPVVEAPAKKSPLIAIIITVVAVLAIAGFFVYQKVIVPKMEAKALQAKQLVLDQKVAAAGEDGVVDFSEDEYDTFLKRGVATSEVNGISTSVNGIQVGIDSEGNAQVAFAYLPNLVGEEEVFVRFDSVKTKDGKEIFDNESSFEEDNDMFTEMELEKRASGQTPFWFGERDIHLTEHSESKNIASASGKVVFMFPTHMQELKLTAEDIGKEQTLAGGFLTLTGFDEKGFTYMYTGDEDNIIAYGAQNASDEYLRRNGYSCGNDECAVYYDNAKVAYITAGKIVEKEYPFTIGAATGNSAQEVKTEAASEKASQAPQEGSVVESSVSQADKENFIAAYFNFEKVLNSKDPKQIVEYVKAAYPENAAEIQAEYDADPNPEDFEDSVNFLKVMLGYGQITSEILNSNQTAWTKEGNSIIAEVSIPDEDGGHTSGTFKVTKQGGAWYMDFQ